MNRRQWLIASLLVLAGEARALKPAKPIKQDRSAPSIAITSPVAGSTIAGSIGVTVAASDNVGVARVTLTAGASTWQLTTAPYTFQLDTTHYSDGALTLTATAYDAAGNQASAAVNVTVKNAVAQQGTTYYVSSSTGSDANPGTQSAPWQTLAKLDAMKATFVAGDSILLMRGDTWAGTLYVYSQAGMAGSTIVYDAYGTGDLPLIDATGQNFGIDVNSVAHIAIRNLHVVNATYDGCHILAGSGNVTDVSVQGVVCERNGRDGFDLEGQPGVYDCDQIEYRDCVANLNGRAGFLAYNASQGATGIHYYTCTATFNGQAIASHGFSGYFANNIHYHGCEASFTNIDPATGLPNAYTTEGHGFVFDDFTSNSSMDGCNSHDNQGAGMVAAHQGSGNTLSTNAAANNRAWGIVVNGDAAGANAIALLGNTVSGNKADGIAAWTPVSGLTIDGNTITDNGGYGIAFSGSIGYTLGTNTLSGNAAGSTNF